MSGKVITSPIEQFPGTITLAEIITMPMLVEYEEYSRAAIAKLSEIASMEVRFGSIVKMCEKWSIQNQPEKPSSYRDLSVVGIDGQMHVSEFRNLMRWLTYEIDQHIGTEVIVPKFLQPKPTDT